jgi:hypothetical protein
VLALFTSLPQFNLWYVRGSEWNGSCAYLDTDELAYAAYTNALIDGRSRRNDPYTGKDNSQHESLFSIQFLPAYALAFLANILRISASTAFLILVPLATVAAALTVLWLLVELTEKFPLAVVGTIGVLCLGSMAALNPLQIFTGVQAGYGSFPFLRRYIPALPFPVFLMSIIFMWRALTRNAAWAALAGLSLALLVFSYFFLWTAAVAWFCTLIVLWFVGRPNDRVRTWRVVGIMIAMGATALVPYSWLLMHRANAIDRAQLLQMTHKPDLFRMPELYGGFLLLTTVWHAKKRIQAFNDPKVLFIASFALAPFVVFNQQIISGRSLQPFHYEEFVANYWIVIGLFLALGVVRQDIPRRILTYLVLGCLATGAVLGLQAARNTRSMNVHLDEVRAVALKLEDENSPGVVFASDVLLTNSIPTAARNPVLWARYLNVFSNLSIIEQKKRFFQYLYYSGFDESQLARVLQTNFTVRWEVFGAERANPVLTQNYNRVTEEELNNAMREYAEFTHSFDSSLAENPVLSYAVVSPNDNLANLDRWYERSAPERIGGFVVYHLRLRSSK